MMKKLLIAITFFAFMQAESFGSPIEAPFFFIGISDSTMKNLEGEWVQSYRAHIYYMPWCELSCYPLYSKCYSDFYKFEIDHVSINYKKINDTTFGVIRQSGNVFYSSELNDNFVDHQGNPTDTIFLKKVINNRWIVDTLKNRSNIAYFLNNQISGTHFYDFYTETEKVFFERKPHRRFGKYLTQHDWLNIPCPPDGGIIVCLAIPTLHTFYLKNDTIYEYGNDFNSFVYNYNTNSYVNINNGDIEIGLSIDSLELEFKNKGSVLRSYHRLKRVVEGDINDYNGEWISSSTDKRLTVYRDRDSLFMRNSNASRPQMRQGNVYSYDFRNTDEHHAFFTSTDECTPSFSRFVLLDAGSSLLEQYTGELYTKVVTVVDDIDLQQSVQLRSNPVTDGNLVVHNVENFDYKIYNSGGMVVSTGKSYDGSINVFDLSEGYFILHLNSQNTILTTKFMILK